MANGTRSPVLPEPLHVNLGDSVLHTELGIRFHLNKEFVAFLKRVKSTNLQVDAQPSSLVWFQGRPFLTHPPPHSPPLSGQSGTWCSIVIGLFPHSRKQRLIFLPHLCSCCSSSSSAELGNSPHLGVFSLPSPSLCSPLLWHLPRHMKSSV